MAGNGCSLTPFEVRLSIQPMSTVIRPDHGWLHLETTPTYHFWCREADGGGEYDRVPCDGQPADCSRRPGARCSCGGGAVPARPRHGARPVDRPHLQPGPAARLQGC